MSVGTALVTAGVFFLVINGYKPQTTRILNPSTFEHPKMIGASIFRRFWTEMQTAKVVVLGEDPRLRDSVQIWDGFIEDAAREGITFDVILSHPKLDEVASYLKTSKRLLIRMETNDANIADLSARGWGGLYFQQSLFVPGADDSIDAQFPCDSDKDQKLACQTNQVSKRYRRKKFPTDRYVGVMERSYPDQAVLYISQPPVVTHE